MNVEPRDISNPFESYRSQLAGKTPDELAVVFAERFDDVYPSHGLYAGTLKDRVLQFVHNRVRAVCDGASQLGKDVWEALHDDHTAHNVERFSLVCGFFASEVLNVGHWPAHEIAALILLIIATLPKSGGST
jgi:hypothetical protein